MKKVASLVLISLVLLSIQVFAVSDDVYLFNQALDKVISEINSLDMNFLKKISLRLKLNTALTYSSQMYFEPVLNSDEAIEVMHGAAERGYSVEKIVSAVYAVDLGRKMGLSEEQLRLVKQVMVTGKGDLKKGGIPQYFLDTVATYDHYELPPCCQ